MVLPRFLSELKRRKVYRVALVYAVVGWALLEASGMVLPRLDLPDWTVNVVLAVVLLGFPLALVFAWVFDFSSQGIVRTEPLSPADRHQSLTIAATVEFVVIVALVVAVGGLYVKQLSLQKELLDSESADQRDHGTDQHAATNPEQYRAIAVLPFADMSEAGDQVWFAEGIAEELLHALAAVDGLQVMARTSSFAFKNTDKTIAQIADILGVQAVLEGSVRRFGERVRITAQLVDADSGYNLWSGSYERQLDDIFELQDELARAVVHALRIELGVDPSKPLVLEQTANLKAYNWFIRGRALYDWPNLETSALAISYFEKAVEADPDYALAWGYLAFAQFSRQFWQPFEVASAAAIPAYERALALDPRQSEALTTKALLTQIREHDWETAGRLYQKAMKAGANLNAIVTYGVFYLQNIGEAERAIQLFVEAEKRDPLYAGYKASLALLYVQNGNAEAAVLKAREALELMPEHQFALMALMEAYTANGDYVGLQNILEKIPPVMQKHPRIRVRVAQSYISQGNYAKAREIYEELLELEIVHLSQAIAQISALAVKLGEVEQAIDLMETAVELNMWNQFWTASWPWLRQNQALRDHRRYLAHLRRMRLDDESIAELHRHMSFD
jgi:TolB-like protein/Tfp pilus assembly protein PilF